METLFKKLKISRLYNLTIPLLGTHPKDYKSAHYEDTCMFMLITVLLTVMK